MYSIMDWIPQTSMDLLKNKHLTLDTSRISRLRIGESQLNIMYGNKDLRTIFGKAFRHIEIPLTDNNNIFNVFVSDNTCKTTHVPRLELNEISGPERKIVTYNAKNCHLMFNPESQALSYIDIKNGVALYDVDDIKNVPYFEIAAPMRYILHWYCENQKKTMIHAAAVGTEAKSFLITGPGGSGKSSTALTCALRGMDYIGDDYVAIENPSRPKALSIYNSAKYRWDAINRIPELSQLTKNHAKDEKGYFFLSESPIASIKRSMPLTAVFFAVIENQNKTTFEPAQPQKILLNLAASSIFQMPGSGTSTLKNIITILEKLPFYRMSLGIDPEEIYCSIKKFVEINL